MGKKSISFGQWTFASRSSIKNRIHSTHERGSRHRGRKGSTWGNESGNESATKDLSKEGDRFGIWQELERALSIVHVAGLELVAEIGVDGEQPESVTRQRFEAALEEFHDVLSVLGILPDSLGQRAEV